ELGAKKAAAAARRNILRQPRAFERFEVHAHIHRPATKRAKHVLQVGVDDVQIDQELGGIESVYGLTGEGVHGGDTRRARGKALLSGVPRGMATPRRRGFACASWRWVNFQMLARPGSRRTWR